VTFVAAIAGIVLAIAMLRGLFADRPAPSTRALAAIGVALLLTFQAVGSLEGSVRALDDRHERFAKLTPREALDHPSAIVGLAAPFNAWAKDHVRRGETFAVLEPFHFGVDRWLAYRLAPNTVARDRASADLLVFFETVDPFARHGLRRGDFERLSWGPDAGLLRRIRAR